MPSRTVQIEPVTPHQDARGWLIEPIDGATLASQRNAHFVVTEPGAVRGNHVHRRGTEVTVAIGPAQVRLKGG